MFDYELAFEPGGKRWHGVMRIPVHGEETLELWLPRRTPGASPPADFGGFVAAVDAANAPWERSRERAQGARRPVPRPGPREGAHGRREVRGRLDLRDHLLEG